MSTYGSQQGIILAVHPKRVGEISNQKQVGALFSGDIPKDWSVACPSKLKALVCLSKANKEKVVIVDSEEFALNICLEHPESVPGCMVDGDLARKRGLVPFYLLKKRS